VKFGELRDLTEWNSCSESGGGKEQGPDKQVQTSLGKGGGPLVWVKDFRLGSGGGCISQEKTRQLQ